ncbi:MAG TPA: hypothetical protein VNJ51_04025 [Candidatus Dormibacteraeota bacterium]|nr:hypothetical protein [Candidatus Dormibacteraeota bacterium]
METTLPTVDELVRIPAPCPGPQSLAFDGEALWVGSWETARLYGIDAHSGSAFEESTAPGKPVGSVAVGDDLWLVCSEEDNSRFFRRYVPGHGFKTSERVPLPDDAGSFLAFDGERLWLSQRYLKRVLELDRDLKPVREIPIGEEIVGVAFVERDLYVSTWWGRDRGGCLIARVRPDEATPQVQWLAQSPFPAISLARDGERLWSNDFKKNEIVAFAIPR